MAQNSTPSRGNEFIYIQEIAPGFEPQIYDTFTHHLSSRSLLITSRGLIGGNWSDRWSYRSFYFDLQHTCGVLRSTYAICTPYFAAVRHKNAVAGI